MDVSTPPNDATALGFITTEGAYNLFLTDENIYNEKHPLVMARSFNLDGTPITESLEGAEIQNLGTKKVN